MTPEVFKYDVRGPVALITMNRPPVNSLGHALRAGLQHALERANSDGAVRAIVLTGTSRAFLAAPTLPNSIRRKPRTSRAWGP